MWPPKPQLLGQPELPPLQAMLQVFVAGSQRWHRGQTVDTQLPFTSVWQAGQAGTQAPAVQV